MRDDQRSTTQEVVGKLKFMETFEQGNFDEKKLIEIVKPYFSSTREGDWEHALRVVRWVKKLGLGRSDLHLLITAAYIHDIGWSGIAPKGKVADLNKMLELEPLANANSHKLVSKVLSKLQFTESEIETVNRLVAAADQHQSNQEDEEIIVDADQLSKLCVEHLQDKYDPSQFLKFLNKWKTEFPNRMKTLKGKKLYPNLLADLERKVIKN